MIDNIRFVVILSIGIIMGLVISAIIFKFDVDYTSSSTSIKEYKTKPIEVEPTFIWNDDIESLPTDGSPILIEFTSKDTIYIGPYEYKQLTYKQ